jgi:hypothetical protein
VKEGSDAPSFAPIDDEACGRIEFNLNANSKFSIYFYCLIMIILFVDL